MERSAHTHTTWHIECTSHSCSTTININNTAAARATFSAQEPRLPTPRGCSRRVVSPEQIKWRSGRWPPSARRATRRAPSCTAGTCCPRTAARASPAPRGPPAPCGAGAAAACAGGRAGSRCTAAPAVGAGASGVRNSPAAPTTTAATMRARVRPGGEARLVISLLGRNENGGENHRPQCECVQREAQPHHALDQNKSHH
eukprot:scaffold11710_cov127-Isochrysis_galbana.AAC.1